ncbi:prepilin peptidase [Tautonia rosea]|uniref:prepilin peptidase n=1 Tax=Tautonia rosea TaxID=2728037 RepID=UPI0014732246|nr:prepilin peptidase [Tautonia rosea]
MRTEETRAGRQLVRLGFVLVAISVLTAEYTLDRPGVHGAFRVLQVALLTGWAVIVHAFLSRRRQSEDVPSVATMLLSCAMVAVLWGVDLGVTIAGMPALAYETMLVLLLRDAALSVIALAGNPICLRLSGGLSLALMLFSSVLGEHRLLYVLATAYALLGSYWLILLYWSFIQIKLLEGTNHRPPVLAILVWGLLVGAMTVLVVGPRRTIGVLGELMPTSGGTTIADASAQSGVGDGPNLAQGINDPTTSGPVDSDIFLETKDTSLYDASTERYGDPEEFNNRRSLAVAIQNQSGELQEEQSRQSNPTREFSVVRGGPRRDSKRPDQSAGEAYSVRGKTPLHLRMLAFDEFDGRSWVEPTLGADSIELQLGFAGWIELPRTDQSINAGAISHEIVVGEIEAPQLPLPPGCDRFRIDRIDRPNFFALAQEGILRYRADALPKQTKLETHTPTIDPVRLRACSMPPGRSYSLPKYLRTSMTVGSPDAPDHRPLDPRIRALAEQWTKGLDRGWSQVEAITDHLRTDYEWDENAVIPSEVDDPIAHFLFEQRRGDDYIFASTACLLLRSLGYPARFVQGLYANPDRYDPDSRWTPVFWPADLHTWVEVQLPTQEWIVVEATPGFEVLGPEPALLARLGEAVSRVFYWIVQHPVRTLGTLAVVGLLVGFRSWLAGVIATLIWRLTFHGGARHSVIVTVRLLERRAQLSGIGRAGSTTLRDWYRFAADRLEDPSAREAIRRLIPLADWAIYAPSSIANPGEGETEVIRSQCRDAVRLCTQSAFRPVSVSSKQRASKGNRRVSWVGAAMILFATLGLESSTAQADGNALPTLPPYPEIFAGMKPSDSERSEETQAASSPSELTMRSLGIETIEDLSQSDQQTMAILKGMTACWFFVLGASVGSFLNVVVYRMPKGLPIWGRSSHCPSCHTALTFRENIPILGWLRLRGRCRSCQTPISPRYPIVETVTGAIFLALLEVQLLSGGGSVPVREPNFYAGVVWILWYPKWDLISLYAYHLILLCTTLCLALIAFDGHRIPRRLLIMTILVGFLGPILMAELHPVPFRLPRPDWLPRSGFSPAELLNSGLGQLTGLLLGGILCLATDQRASLVAVLMLAGIFLGWQAAISIALLTALAMLMVQFGSSTVLPGLRAIPPAFTAAMAILVQTLCWRWFSGLAFWPSHLSSPIAMIGAVTIIAGLSSLTRVMQQRQQFGTNHFLAPESLAPHDPQHSISPGELKETERLSPIPYQPPSRF